jgi:cytochrome P450
VVCHAVRGRDRGAERSRGWLRDFVESRRKAPQDDLASALITATTDDGSPALSTSEIVNLVGTILSAGSSTTVNFIPLFMRLLLSQPGQIALIREDPQLMRRAVEEALRRSTSVYGVPRVTTRPVTLGGVDIPAGADLYVHYAAAQRDDAVFDDPEHRVDVHVDPHRP